MRASIQNAPARGAYRVHYWVVNRSKPAIRPINLLTHAKGHLMNNIVYIVGVVVIVVALLSFFGLR